MSQLVVKIDSKTDTWNVNRRYKVGKAIVYGCFYWTNITGANTEPGVANDWLQTGTIFQVIASTVINGNRFHLYKAVGNNDKALISTLQVNDIVIGWFDANTFFVSVIYIGGDVNLRASYNEVNTIENIVPI